MAPLPLDPLAGAGATYCSAAAVVAAEAKAQPAYKDLFDKLMSQIIPLYNAAVGTSPTSEQDIEHFVDCLFVHVCNGGELPTGVTYSNVSQIYNSITEVKAFINNYKNSSYSRLAYGALLRDILIKIEDTVTNKKSPKFALYSAHDSTLFPLNALLRAGGAKEWPQYADLVSLELFVAQSNGSYYIRLVSHGEPVQVGFVHGSLPSDTYIMILPYRASESFVSPSPARILAVDWMSCDRRNGLPARLIHDCCLASGQCHRS